MKTQHTPGPWFLDQYGHVYGMEQHDNGNHQSVCLVDNRHSGATFADKRLIAAAPELLEALDAIPIECEHEWPHTLACWACKAKAAIAKARGGV